ncbi:hypothetical protein QJS10_CPB18g01396 [Acorus calamus]|uniref:Uncharacterized protein n=1 Tax=Acorus calamus TaxID=4465 RepID=A0AAV9CLY5_ACOCL|nr:hypothetical protein QJS10_CPB18g01396 [Acorus calamus]
MERSSLHLLVNLLVFSHLFFSDAIPLTRTQSLFHGTQLFPAAIDIDQNNVITQDAAAGEEYINGRIDLENIDYVPTQPNGRHTPPPGRA